MKESQASREARLIFMAMMECVLKGVEGGQSKEDFLEFATGVWETMELNGYDAVREAINKMMEEDIRNTAEDEDEDE